MKDAFQIVALHAIAPVMKAILKYLLFSLPVLWVTGCTSVVPVVKRSATARMSDFVVWASDFRSEDLKNSYRFTLKTRDNNITGLFILKRNGNEWRGTLMNEMGAKAFDFIVTNEKCKLLNVIPLMDKWYIKKTLAADLFFLINVDNPEAPFRKKMEQFEQNDFKVVNYQKKQLLVKPDGTIQLINRSRNLQYELMKIIEINPDKVILL